MAAQAAVERMPPRYNGKVFKAYSKAAWLKKMYNLHFLYYLV